MNNVTMVYENSDVAALDNFSLTINEGEFAFLVGPSGSGKTTIIKLLTGEIRPSDGKVVRCLKCAELWALYSRTFALLKR